MCKKRPYVSHLSAAADIPYPNPDKLHVYRCRDAECRMWHLGGQRGIKKLKDDTYNVPMGKMKDNNSLGNGIRGLENIIIIPQPTVVPAKVHWLRRLWNWVLEVIK